MHMCTICIASSKIQSVQRLFPLQKCAALFLNCHFIDIKDSQKYVTYKCYKTVYSWDGYIFFKFAKLLKWSCDYCGEVVTVVVKWWSGDVVVKWWLLWWGGEVVIVVVRWWRLWWGGDGCGEVVTVVVRWW
jgi:hypothetical protein